MSPPSSGTDAQRRRAPRADARRNLERLISASQTAVAELGMDVSPKEIARRAGVGVGTFYRRVESREDLLEQILAELMSEAAAQADDALADPDPWTGLARFAEAYVELRLASRGVCEALDGRGGEILTRARGELSDAFRRLVSDAQQTRAVRRDLAWQDVPFMLAAVIPPAEQVGLRAGPDQWRRNLRVVLDGISARTQAMPGDPPRSRGIPSPG